MRVLAFLVALLAVVGSFVTPARAAGIPTIYDNYQMFPVGSRAAGMGGAYTALACDEGALHYNPASLACAADSHLELAANAYMIQAATIPGAVGRGQDISAVTYHSIPSIVGGVRILSEGDKDGAGRFAFGLTVSVPQSLALKVDPPNPDQVNYIALSVREDITAADVGLAYQFNKYFGIGIGIGAVLHTAEIHAQELITRTFQVACGPPPAMGDLPEGCTDFFMTVTDEEYLAIAGRAKLGIRITPTPEVSLGLMLTSPTLDIYGTSQFDETDAYTLTGATNGQNFSLWGALPTRLRGSSDVGFPLRLAIGAAYSTPKLTISGDVSLNFPRDIRLAYDQRSIDVKGIPPPDASALKDVILHTTFQPNVNIGLEIALSPTKVVDLGAFTDFSNVDNTGLAAEDQRDRVHMFGGSLALGILGRQSRGWFGASFEIGMADTPVPSGSFDLDQIIQTGLPLDGTSTITRWSLSGIIGSNYSFIAEDKPGVAPPPPAPPPPPVPPPAPQPTLVPAPPPPPPTQ